MLAEGSWHLHQFSVADDTGALRHAVTLYPLPSWHPIPASNTTT